MIRLRLLILALWLCPVLTACDRHDPPPAPAAAPDPDAPPPGSEAAEAIGSDPVPVTRP